MAREFKKKREKRERGERFWRRRVCRFCEDPRLRIDYKDGRALSPYISERGRILPRRITSSCAYHQRQLNAAIKRARLLALLPYTATQVKW